MFNLSVHLNMERKFILLQSHMFNLSLQASSLNIANIRDGWSPWSVFVPFVVQRQSGWSTRMQQPEMSLTGILGMP